MCLSAISLRRAAEFRGQERGRDPWLFDLVCGVDQRSPLQAGAGERRTDLQRQLCNHRLLPVALCQAAPQRDGSHSHTPHTLCLLLTGWLAALHTVGCTSQCAALAPVPFPGIKPSMSLCQIYVQMGFSTRCNGNRCQAFM